MVWDLLGQMKGTLNSHSIQSHFGKQTSYIPQHFCDKTDVKLVKNTEKVYWVMMHSNGRQQFLNFKMIYEVEHWSELDNKLLSACSSSSSCVCGWFVFNPFLLKGDSSHSQVHKEMKTLTSPSPNTFRMNRSDCEPDLITQHRCLSSLMLSCLTGS